MSTTLSTAASPFSLTAPVHAGPSHAGAKPAGPLAALRRWLAYRETLGELSRLSQRELDDIGVEGDVAAFAWRLANR